MTLDITKPVCTRDGRKARILSTTEKSVGQYSYPIRAEVEHPSKPGEMISWCYMANGQWKSNDSCNHNDLINEMFWHVILHEIKDNARTTRRQASESNYQPPRQGH